VHPIYAAAIVMPDADLSLAVPAVFFGSIGTAGQRCTSTRRLYLHHTIAPEFLARLQKLYTSAAALRPGDPLDAGTLLGPLHSRAALDVYDDAIKDLKAAGAQILVGGGDGANGGGRSGGRFEDLQPPLDRGNFVRPTIAIPNKHPKSMAKFTSKNATAAAANADPDANSTGAAPVVDHGDWLWGKERFAPVLLVAEFDELEEAIAWNNAVPQGLSSSLWTRDVRNVGKWIGPAGSDAGIVNVRAPSYFSFKRRKMCVDVPFVPSPFLPLFCSFRRLMSARAVQRLARHLAVTRSVSSTAPYSYTSVWTDIIHSCSLSSLLRAPGGVVNPAVTRGNNMCVGAHARSTFPTRHRSRKVSTLIRHETKQGAPLLAQREIRESDVTFSFCVRYVCCQGEGHYGSIQFYKKRREEKKVIINHIYDAVQEPT
jgi:hypothetical protein